MSELDQLAALLDGLTSAPPLQDPPKPVAAPPTTIDVVSPGSVETVIVGKAEVAVATATAVIPPSLPAQNLLLTPDGPVIPQNPVVIKNVTEPEIAAKTEDLGAFGGPADDVITSEFNLKTFIDPKQLKADISVSLTNLDDAIRNHAGLLVHYSMQAARARHQEENTKNALKLAEARLYKAHRDELSANGKVTEAQIEAAVTADARMVEAKNKMAEATLIADLCNAAREGFMQRRDMLVQVSVDRRNEAQGEMRIRAAQDARTQVTNQILGRSGV